MFRIIIFPASRPINIDEQENIFLKISDFLTTWKAHGNSLVAELEIIFQQFILIKINENIEPASGCSLDVLNGMMREIENQYHLGIFDRMKACFIINKELKTLPLKEFKDFIRNEKNSTDIHVFDFSIANSYELQERFLLPLPESWAKGFLSQ